MDKTTENARQLRRNQTEAEKLLWSKLRNSQFHDLKFRRQHPFPPYILDFYCDDLKLVIELDGGQHNEEKDKERTEFLKQKEICIAKIATAHGIKGLVKLHVFADDSSLADGILFTSEGGDKTLSLKLKNQTAKHWLAEVEGITDRNEAEKLRGTELYIDKDNLPEANDDEFYIADLIGLSCIDKDNKHIGKIIAVENFGASDLLEIQPDGGESFYLPFTDDTTLKVSDTTVTIDIPEGLID